MRVLVTGASGGLGGQVVACLQGAGHTVFRFDTSISQFMDVRVVSEERLESMKFTDLDALISCSGINQNEWFSDVTYESFISVMNVSAWGMISMVQATLPLMKEDGARCVISVVSSAAHMPMTSSLAYNASKAAALMATEQMAHELSKTHDMHILLVSPNKLEGTGMSDQIDVEVQRVRGWTAEYADRYQKAGLMHQRETDPHTCAMFITELLLAGHYRYLGMDATYNMANDGIIKFAVVDYETTGLNLHPQALLRQQPRAIEFAGIITDGETIFDELEFICNPMQEIEPIITKITGLTNADLATKQPFKMHVPEFVTFCEQADCVMSHNLSFDETITKTEARHLGLTLTDFAWPHRRACTVEQTFHMFGRRMKLKELYQIKSGTDEQKHRAMDDVIMLHRVCKAFGIYEALTRSLTV